MAENLDQYEAYFQFGGVEGVHRTYCTCDFADSFHARAVKLMKIENTSIPALSLCDECSVF